MDRVPDITVFIVEDSTIVRDALVDLLECLPGVTIAGSAGDPTTAIDAIARSRPDYVVLDYQLVGGTAVDVLRALRAESNDIIFIVLTNHATAQHRRVCMEAGASSFLDKTLEFDQVKEIIAPQRAPL
jgi:DNA-binding NarL/FixJ family response regulator